MEKKIRVLVGKPGLDGHDRGARVIAAALRDAGMEVVYTGLRAGVPAIAAAAVQEDVDVIGLSILSGAHEGICRRLTDELRARGADIPVVVGGIIPTADHDKLREIGVAAVFGPESPLGSVVEAIKALASGEPLPEPPRPAPGIPATRLDHTAILQRNAPSAMDLSPQGPLGNTELAGELRIESSLALLFNDRVTDAGGASDHFPVVADVT